MKPVGAPRSPWRWFASGLLAGTAIVTAVSLLAGAGPYHQLGNADPGAVVAVGAPVLRLLADVAGVVCLGGLAFGVLCTRPQDSGLLSAAAYAEVRIAGAAAAVWCTCAVLLVPFSAADVAGQPLSEALVPEHLLGLVGAVETPRAWLITAAVAAMVGLGCRAALRWQTVAGLAALALAGLLPALVTGHGSSDVGHDLATAALLVHVPAAALWIGLLLSVLRHARRVRGSGPPSAEPLTRYGRVAFWCWLVLIASGLALGAVLVPVDQLAGNGYGALLLGKTAVVVVVGAGGLVLRRRALRRIVGDGGAGRPGLVQLAAAEVVLLLAVLGASVGLTHLPLPGFLGRALTTNETLLGYELHGPPTVLRLLTDWRPDLVFAPLAVALAIGYLLALRRARSRGVRWPHGRTAAWLLGCLTLLLATSSGLGRYAGAMFSVHQASHMLVAMLAPALLALGGPLTLLRAASPAPGSQPLPTMREVLDRVAGSRPARVLTHPVVALGLFAGAPFALYFTGLFDALVRFHWGHILINVVFLAIGYLFCWPVIGVDPVPRPLPNLARLGMLLAAMPADILFGALLIGTDRVLGNGPAASMMYQALALPWVPDLVADQRLGGIIALAIGEFAMFVMVAALLARWHRVDDTDPSGLGGHPTLARTRG